MWNLGLKEQPTDGQDYTQARPTPSAGPSPAPKLHRCKQWEGRTTSSLLITEEPRYPWQDSSTKLQEPHTDSLKHESPQVLQGKATNSHVV